MSMAADVIIVGAGSAGCVLACRLTENPDRRVLLIEAGPDYPTLQTTPPDITDGLTMARSHDWGITAETGEPGRVINVPRPRIVGGSSATNATFALRGLPADYDAWAAAGNPGWSWAEVLPGFRRLESDRDIIGLGSGNDGPLPIRRYRPDELTPVQSAFLAAAAARGYPVVTDHNAAGAVGAGPIPTNTVDGIRQSAALTYLARARSRPNLTILSDALVGEVVFDGNRAVGVRIAGAQTAGARAAGVRATGGGAGGRVGGGGVDGGPAVPEVGDVVFGDHVILAAGTFGSPAILMRSGIGPADSLRTLGIRLRADLPGVGRSLADHPLWALCFAALRPTDPDPVAQFQTLLTLSLAAEPAGLPFDAQIFPTSIVPCGMLQSVTGGVFTLCVSVMRPVSRGWLELTSVDPAIPPRVNFNYLADARDVDGLVQAARQARLLAATQPLADLALGELYPGVAVESMAAMELAIRSGIATYHHACGTCRMGPDSDVAAVVDSGGSVRGVVGLSVIDASILPGLPSANIHLTTLMVAELCAARFTYVS